jgi:hypothetical protein
MNDIRLYIIDLDLITEDIHPDSMTNEQFVNEAEKHGLVYTLQGFQQDVNQGLADIMTNNYIRFININSITQ